MAFSELHMPCRCNIVLPLIVIIVSCNGFHRQNVEKMTMNLKEDNITKQSEDVRLDALVINKTTTKFQSVKIVNSDSHTSGNQSTDHHADKGGFMLFNASVTDNGCKDVPDEDVHFDIDEGNLKTEKWLRHGHGNLFSCPPCKCSHTKTQKIKADCVSAKLRDIPTTLPVDVWAINMSYNHLHSFNTSSILRYTNLFFLDLSHNLIKKVQGLLTNILTSQLTLLNLNDNIINEIENDSVCVMRKLFTLRISNNKLTSIGKATFRCLPQLRRLDVSKNVLTHIDDTAFDALKCLRSLYIERNQFLGYHPRHFGPRIAQNLQRLKELNIQGNSNGAIEYPNELLGTLTNLETLFIDGLGKNAEFGPQLRKLVHLKSLSVGLRGRCHLKIISSTFFSNTPKLTSLTFTSCLFQNVDPLAFKHIPYLEEYALRFITNKYLLDNAFKDIEMLNTYNSSLRSLSFVHVHHSTVPCKTLTGYHGQYIKNMRLESLDLGLNRIALIRNDFLDCIPETLKILKLGGNKLTLSGNLWGKMSFLENLLKLDVSDQNMDAWPHKHMAYSHGPWYLQGDQVNNEFLEESHIRDNRQNDLPELSNIPSAEFFTPMVRTETPFREDGPSHCIGKQSTRYSKTIEKMLDMGILCLPPNLREVDASRHLFYASVLLFHKLSTNSLTHLNFSYNFQPDWGYGRLPQKVEMADFSNNQCTNIQSNFFHPQNNLTALWIQANVLGPAFAKDNGTIFRCLGKLHFLDMSENLIFKLPTQFFQGLKNLNYLNMQENKIQQLDVHLSHLQNLTYIDASKNSISWISKKTRDDLDVLASRSDKTITLDLTENPLPCTCDGIEILLWINDSNVFFINYDFLHCHYSNGSKASLSDIAHMIRKLRYDCTSYRDLIVGAVSSLSGLFIAFLTCGFLYKKRWRLLYSINNGVLVRIFGFQPHGEPNSNKYKFDAYVVYDEEDRDFVLDQLLEEIETKRGHKVCVEDRNFLPGTYNFNNINSAVQTSAVTLLVVSKELLKSDDFHYVIQVALLEEHYSQDKREVCHLVLYDQLSGTDLPKDLQMLMVKNRFIAYPPSDEDGINAEVYQGFWDRLSLVIGHSTSPGEQVRETSPLL